MGVTTALLTVEEYAQLPEEETMRTELVEGEIVRMGDAKLIHELVKSNAAELLIEYILQNRIGRVFSESMFKLGPREGRIPDVTLLLKDRLAQQNRDGFLEGAPDLALEVVSSESAAFLERKVNLFLARGCRSFWVAYPAERTFWIHRAAGVHIQLREGQYVEEPDLLPGFRALVDRFFDGI
jgi:Uma2 family endonuclease